MPAAGANVNCRHRFNRKELSIEFDLPFTIEDQVDLRGLFVIVRAGVLLDVDDVHAGRRIGQIGKGAAGKATGARLGGNLRKLRDREVHSSFARQSGPGLRGSGFRLGSQFSKRRRRQRRGRDNVIDAFDFPARFEIGQDFDHFLSSDLSNDVVAHGGPCNLGLDGWHQLEPVFEHFAGGCGEGVAVVKDKGTEVVAAAADVDGIGQTQPGGAALVPGLAGSPASLIAKLLGCLLTFAKRRVK